MNMLRDEIDKRKADFVQLQDVVQNLFNEREDLKRRLNKAK
jgi:hypothetical protein